MRRHLFLIFLPILLCASGYDQRLSALEQQMASASFLPPEVCAQNWMGLTLTVDGLYWNAKVGGTERAYAYISKKLDIEKKEYAKELDFDWALGYRVGGGLSFPGIKRELYARWTHFDTSNSGAKIKYEALDAGIKRGFFLSKFICLHTLLGVRKAWIDFKDHEEKLKFKGLGPMLALHSYWYLFLGLNIRANVSGGFLGGNTEIKFSDLKHIDKLINPFAGAFLGLGWDRSRRWGHIGIALGYEVEYYWKQELKAEDIVFYGATLKLRLDF